MGPYDSIRDYVADLEERGKCIRIKEMDQDLYEATAFLYTLMDRMRAEAPCFLLEKTKINGRWYETPVIGNALNGFDMVAQCLGVDYVSDDQAAMFTEAGKKISACLKEGLGLPFIEPRIVDRKKAPCKEVCLKGADADLFQFPWIQNNPGDGGQYISTGAFIIEDEELGRNVAIHRMQVKEARKAGANFAGGCHAHQIMMRAKAKGKKKIDAAVAIGVDPITWMISASRMTGLGEDEFALSGGFRRKPVELIKCETIDLHVPAHAEIILEGEIPMEMEQEGPYGEMHGYMGSEKQSFFMNIKAITHRHNPWVWNFWPGAEHSYMSLPANTVLKLRLKEMMPNLVELFSLPDVPAIGVASIDKRFPGEGIEAGLMLFGYRPFGFTRKVIIVVDKDVAPNDIPKVIHSMGTRWQPVPASHLIDQTFHSPMDPSLKEPFLSSKIIIDATKQLPGEGGPDAYPENNLAILEKEAPSAFEMVKEKWDTYFQK
ncbi:MAG: UbiD family decarboxylase [Deltaproteobacteria bacterium]|nr:UbiD family decarboxylase [Deltaproteobacteria bacterium]